MEDTNTWSTAFDALVAPLASLIASTRHTAAHRVLNFNCEHNTYTHKHTALPLVRKIQ